jgi:valyl-tRNA synthetase
MSKSLGNVIDPIDIIDGIELEALHEKLLGGNLDPTEVQRAKEYQKSAFPKGIAECGTDALRFALVNYTTGGGDIAFDIKVIEAYRRFCNKIYQATNFALGRLGEDFVPAPSSTSSKPTSLAEKWILHRLNSTATEVNAAIDDREFNTAASSLYQFLLTSLCDTFIENTKSIFQPEVAQTEQASAKQTLYTALEGGLLLLHPIMPFITEHLWQKLPRRTGDKTPSIMIANYPQADPSLDYPEDAAKYEFVMDVSKGVRSMLAQYNFKEPTKDIFVQTFSDDAFQTASAEQTSIKSLGGKYVGGIEILKPGASTPEGCAVYAVSAEAAVYLKIVGKVDLSKEKEKAEASLTEAKGKVEKSRKIMGAEGFKKVKQETREKEERNLKDAESEVSRFDEVLKDLERLRIEGTKVGLKEVEF